MIETEIDFDSSIEELMRICLTTTQYPPEGFGGIPKQREVLAKALVRLGHEVHIITQGRKSGRICLGNLTIHLVPPINPPLPFSAAYPEVNYYLSHSLSIYKQIQRINQEKRIDIVDFPLWGLEGVIPLYQPEIPSVLWLQTSRAHMVSIDGRAPTKDESGVIGLERECLLRAPAIIADSKTALVDFERIFQLPDLHARAKPICLGIPDIFPAKKLQRLEKPFIEILLVGRLEKRKGTDLFFSFIPDILKLDPKVQIRFIGADNSRWDGFYNEHLLSYPDYFKQNWPDLQNRVIFEGAATDERIVEAYQLADLLIVPSQYESFGIIYLEAMRAHLPVITYSLGAAPEIFPDGDQNGAILVDPNTPNGIVDAVRTLLKNPERRIELGEAGRKHFETHFVDTRMAQDTVEFYAEVIDKWTRPSSNRSPRVIQVLDAVTTGDAVSTIALDNSKLLNDQNIRNTILSQHIHSSLTDQVQAISRPITNRNSVVFFHYWNYSYIADRIRNYTGRKAFYFHNITPPRYFSVESPGFSSTSKGYEQIPQIINDFDLLVGDSSFNLSSCKPYLTGPLPGLVIPPTIHPQEITERPFDPRLVSSIQDLRGTKMLFVGRIVRNKRQDSLIRAFDHFRQNFDRKAQLFLVGSDEADPQYHAELNRLCNELGINGNVIFTGKVTQEQLYSYYRIADVFLCASEHEGFCVPLLEAMAFDIPVIAFSSSAIPETMGDSGIIMSDFAPQMVASKIDEVLQERTRYAVIQAQRNNLTRFSSEVSKARLSIAYQYLITQERNALITDIAPE